MYVAAAVRMGYTGHMATKPAHQHAKKQPAKVSFEPNKMGLAVAALAAVSLLLLALIATM